jgi:glycosyltransferase involved in cell wall biosynthesis
MGRIIFSAMSLYWPRISIITPSFNQAAFLERTITSVLEQNYPNLEYIVIDGGSSDDSVDIIRKYESKLAFWISEPDQGQTHAINKGLMRATGDWIGWQNSDDIYYPSALRHVALAADQNPKAELIIGDINLIDELDKVIRELKYVRPTYESLLTEGMVLANQSSFWRRELHDRVGWLDESLHFGFDYEWFLRVLKETDRAVHVTQCFGALRYHDSTKTSRSQALFDEEFRIILAGRVQPGWKKKIYQARRMFLTLANGHFAYVFRGLKRRSSRLGR